jgi:hypothetical protein
VIDWKPELLWNLVGYATALAIAVIALAGLCLFLLALRRRWLPLPRLRPVTWTGFEVFLAFCVLNGVSLVITSLLMGIGFFRPLLGPMPEINPDSNSFKLYSGRCEMISSPLNFALTLAVLF